MAKRKSNEILGTIKAQPDADGIIFDQGSGVFPYRSIVNGFGNQVSRLAYVLCVAQHPRQCDDEHFQNKKRPSCLLEGVNNRERPRISITFLETDINSKFSRATRSTCIVRKGCSCSAELDH